MVVAGVCWEGHPVHVAVPGQLPEPGDEANVAGWALAEAGRDPPRRPDGEEEEDLTRAVDFYTKVWHGKRCRLCG